MLMLACLFGSELGRRPPVLFVLSVFSCRLHDPFFFFALCCLGKIPGGAPFSQLHKSGNGSRVDRP